MTAPKLVTIGDRIRWLRTERGPEWIMHGRGSPGTSTLPAATEQEFIKVFKSLSPEHQAALLAAAKSLV